MDLDEAFRGDRRPVDSDPLGHGVQVGAGEGPVPQASGLNECLDHARRGRLAVRAGHVNHPSGPLWVPQQFHHPPDPRQGRNHVVLRGPGEQLVGYLGQVRQFRHRVSVGSPAHGEAQ